MKIVYSPRYHVDIGRHVFPTEKYRLVRDRLIADRVIDESALVEPQPASWDDLALVHTAGYLDKLRAGTITGEDAAQLELPWSEGMVEGFRLMVGGTILAAHLACPRRSTQNPRSPQSREAHGVSASSANSALNVVCHLGGGLHHAFPNHGEGFCPFNDVAVAIRVLQRDLGLERVAVVDLDVHHGNGTAFIFNPGGAPPPPDEDARFERRLSASGGDPRVFTFSMHQQHNYPMWKPAGSLDVGLPDGTRDPAYLEALAKALPAVLAQRPECVFYLAGADPYEDDQLGGLRLTAHGLRQRDRMVIQAVAHEGIPLVIVLAGGYARHVEDTVAIHVATIEEALQLAG